MNAPAIVPASTRATVTIQNANGEVIRTSKNLRGILRYASEVSPVEVIYCDRATPFDPEQLPFYQVEFKFYDGSSGFANFADWRVLRDWIEARKSWRFGIRRVNGLFEFCEAMRDYLWKYRATA